MMENTIKISVRRYKDDGVPDSYAKAIEESCVRELFDKAHFEVLAFDQPYRIQLRRKQHRIPWKRLTLYDYELEITKLQQETHHE